MVWLEDTPASAQVMRTMIRLSKKMTCTNIQCMTLEDLRDRFRCSTYLMQTSKALKSTRPKQKSGQERKTCIHRESNPELGHGKTQCYRYTTNAW